MGTILDYAERERHGFDERPFNAVDALILSSLAYQDMPDTVTDLAGVQRRYGTLRSRLKLIDPMHPIAAWRPLRRAPFPGTRLDALTERLERHEFIEGHGPKGLTDPHLTMALYAKAGRNPRFSGIEVAAFDRRFSAEHQTQFAAETFRLPDGTLAIAFQGTDDSFVGWKEDFNMAFQYPVPAQESAADYLASVATLWQGPITLMGHSKGGNLAVYAALHASGDLDARITRVYSLDGPGFPEEVVCGERYRSLISRIDKIVPSSSIVGMILETPEPSRVVQSDQRGIMQHLAFSWQVEGDGFVELPAVSPGSRYFNTSLNTWLRGMSTEQRHRTVDALFSVLHATGAEGFTTMMASFPRVLPEMIGRFAGLSDEDRRNILFAANLLIRARFDHTFRGTQHISGDDAADSVTPSSVPVHPTGGAPSGPVPTAS